MSKEVVAVRSLKPGNFETSVEGVRVLEVNKDEGADLELIMYVRSFIRSWNGRRNQASCGRRN
jgi:hypothetical protein